MYVGFGSLIMSAACFCIVSDPIGRYELCGTLYLKFGVSNLLFAITSPSNVGINIVAAKYTGINLNRDGSVIAALAYGK
jgi:hypothetical protein